MHLLQLVNYYASIIYAAFLKGMSVGSPGGYDHLFGFHHEEDYEAGTDTSIEAKKYAIRVEPVRTLLTSKLKVERRLVGESLQSDLLHICKQSTEKSLTPAPLIKLFSYKNPLVDHEAYATYKFWMGQSHHKQFLSPSTQMRKHINESTTVKVLSSREGNEKPSSCIMLNFANFLWENSGKLIMVVLTTQVAAVQPIHNSSQMDLISEGNATDSFSMIPALAMNNASFNVTPKNTLDLVEIHQYVSMSEELLQKILHQSDTIMNDRQELVNFLSTYKDTKRPPEERSDPNTLPRVVRSLPVEKSSTCKVEQYDIIKLRNELQDFLKQYNAWGSTDCPLNFDSDRCEEIMKLGLCGCSLFIRHFTVVRENRSVAILMENRFAECKERYMRLLDDVNMLHSYEYNETIINFKIVFQDMEEQFLMKENRIESCISDICSGKIERAMENFTSLNDDSVLPTIIRSVYSKCGYLGQVDNISKFIKKFPSCSLEDKAFTVLFDEMHKNDHLISPNVLIVAHAAEGCMGGTFMKPYVTCVIDTWAYKVRVNMDKEYIIDFAGKHTDAFRANLPDLIDKAYGDKLSNVENVIFFVGNLPHIEDSSVGYSSLFNKMRSNGHVNSYQTLILATRVKECMEMPHYPNIGQYYKDKFNTLKCDLPNSVKSLIWSSRNNCTIYNVNFGEYLYTADNFVAYTWVEDYVFEKALWKLEMVEGGKLFKIINTRFNRTLFSSQEKRDEERRNVNSGTCWDCPDTNWRLEPLGDIFFIWNPWRENYIYCASFRKDPYRRFVFGWIPDSYRGSEKIKWRIVC
ncbi:uncharacterized protein LOC124169039 [Ischnura elegans]|uniref:uncharacterized protein LOC124169039 n=1 Tax=Ischnura elegans TaxID=197161 RepID=UPI001ED86F8B|nr:uncharacterized protein LOC124169039 [Ischnura elegans]